MKLTIPTKWSELTDWQKKRNLSFSVARKL